MSSSSTAATAALPSQQKTPDLAPRPSKSPPETIVPPTPEREKKVTQKKSEKTIAAAASYTVEGVGSGNVVGGKSPRKGTKQKSAPSHHKSHSTAPAVAMGTVAMEAVAMGSPGAVHVHRKSAIVSADQVTPKIHSAKHKSSTKKQREKSKDTTSGAGGGRRGEASKPQPLQLSPSISPSASLPLQRVNVGILTTPSRELMSGKAGVRNVAVNEVKREGPVRMLAGVLVLPGRGAEGGGEVMPNQLEGCSRCNFASKHYEISFLYFPSISLPLSPSFSLSPSPSLSLSLSLSLPPSLPLLLSLSPSLSLPLSPRSASPSSDVNDDVVHCLCGDDTDEGFMIQVNTHIYILLASFFLPPHLSLKHVYMAD